MNNLRELCSPSFDEERLGNLMEEVKKDGDQIKRIESKIFFSKGDNIFGFNLNRHRDGKRGGNNVIKRARQIGGNPIHGNYAMKVSLSDSSKDIEQEVHILTLLNKDGGHIGIPQKPSILETSGKTIEIMEFLLCNLSQRVSNRIKFPIPLSEKEQVKIFLDSLGALCSCLKMGIIRGDVKGDNIMLDAKKQAWLIDFGGSKEEAKLTSEYVANSRTHLMIPCSPGHYSEYDKQRIDEACDAIKSLLLYKQKKASLCRAYKMGPSGKTEDKTELFQFAMATKYQNPDHPHVSKEKYSPKDLLEFISSQFSKEVKEELKRIGILSHDQLFKHTEGVEESLLEDLILLLRKADVFATGVTFAKFFFGDLKDEFFRGSLLGSPQPQQAFPFLASTPKHGTILSYEGFYFEPEMKLEDLLDISRFNKIPKILHEPLKKMLAPNPEDRPTMKEAYHSFKLIYDSM